MTWLFYFKGVMLGVFYLHHHPNPFPIPAFGPQIKPPSQATLQVRIDAEGWVCVIRNSLDSFHEKSSTLFDFMHSFQ